MPEFTGDRGINTADRISASTDHLHIKPNFIAKIKGSQLKIKCSPWQNFQPY